MFPPQTILDSARQDRQLPRGVVVLLCLHHVPQAGVGQGLGEVGVRSHEAVVVQAWSHAGRAEALGSALRLAGVGRQAIKLGGQVCPKESLQQLERKKGVTTMSLKAA